MNAVLSHVACGCGVCDMCVCVCVCGLYDLLVALVDSAVAVVCVCVLCVVYLVLWGCE